MALENITNIVNPLKDNLWSNLPPELLAPFAKLITILQVVGIVIIVYVLYLLIKGILNWRRNKRIDITYEKVLQIDRKLDEVLKRTAKKEKLPEKKEKKPGFFSRLFGKHSKKH
ncbi:MAG: hypothetical protein AABW67_04405 [Nanoarchaeota archaeon]